MGSPSRVRRDLRGLRRRRGIRVAALAAAAWLLGAATVDAVELVLSDMTYVESDSGVRGLVLSAERARVAPDGDLAHLEGVALDAAGEEGGSSVLMTCERALLNLRTSDFTAEGDVRGRTADGHRFWTESARFRHAARVIEGNEAVDIIDPTGTRLEGKGFWYDVRSQRMRMREAVVSELVEESSE